MHSYFLQQAVRVRAFSTNINRVNDKSIMSYLQYRRSVVFFHDKITFSSLNIIIKSLTFQLFFDKSISPCLINEPTRAVTAPTPRPKSQREPILHKFTNCLIFSLYQCNMQLLFSLSYRIGPLMRAYAQVQLFGRLAVRGWTKHLPKSLPLCLSAMQSKNLCRGLFSHSGLQRHRI